MTALYRFLDVRYEGAERVYTFTLHSGELRLLQLADKTEKGALIDWAIGESICAEGSIEIMREDGRLLKSEAREKREERRIRTEPIPVIWCPIQESRLGRVGWVAANGGLISNLKVWENITLPLWYHSKRDVAETEQSVEYWLTKLGLESSDFPQFMAALPYSIEPWQRKLAGLLRALVQMPRVLIVDASVFEDVKARVAQTWISALETYASQGRAVLVLTDKATVLPWGKIE